ncbi:hypothetical protein D9M68_708280 [compost metagenome]
MHDAGNRQVALLVHAAHAAEAGAGHGGAVVAVDAADDHLLLRLALERPVVADQAQQGVVAFRAGAGEEHMVHAGRGDLGQRLGQLQHRRVGGLEEGVVERQLAHLPAGRLDQFLAAVADGDAPQAGHAIEDLLPLAVPQVHALGLGDDPRALLVHLLVVGERREMVLTAHGLPFAGFRVGHCIGHNNTFIARAARATRWNSWQRARPDRARPGHTDSSRNSRSQELITRL